MKKLNTIRPGLRLQRGLSLVEIAIALVLVAGLVIGAATWVRQIEVDKQLNSARTDALASMNAAVAAYAMFPTTSGANVQILSGQGIWPSDRVTSPGTTSATVRGHFKGSNEYMVSNTGANGNLAANRGFMYHIVGVPARACSQFVTSLASHPNTQAIWAGDRPTRPSTGGGTPSGLTSIKSGTAAINMTSLATGCRGSNVKQVSVMFFKS